jgi:hypothetical protein
LARDKILAQYPKGTPRRKGRKEKSFIIKKLGVLGGLARDKTEDDLPQQLGLFGEEN